MIVGTKIERYLTAERVAGEPWKMTFHVVQTELHATKGWRKVSHRRQVNRVASLPPLSAWRAADTISFKRSRYAPRSRVTPHLVVDRASSLKKMERSINLGAVAPQPTERELMEHGWYRRKLRKEAEERVKDKLTSLYGAAA